VAASHEIIDRNLRAAGLGRLEYHVPPEECAASVWDQMTDGYHQIGMIRMAAAPSHGVVDADCRVHGTPNLFVASSAVFATSGQANPTLLITALSARLAAHVARLLQSVPTETQIRERNASSATVRPSFTTESHPLPVTIAE
jgi:choline dehydrogenase-like flavoprotein